MKRTIMAMLVLSAVALTAAPARAEVGLNIRAGGVWNCWDNTEGDQEAPAGLLHLAVGYRPIKFLNLGLDSLFDVVDNDADMFRITAFGRVEIPIAKWRIWGGAGLGYWNKHAIDIDYGGAFKDQGFTYNFDIGVDWSFLKFLGVSLYGSLLMNKSGYDKNPDYPERVKNFVLGLDVILQF